MTTSRGLGWPRGTPLRQDVGASRSVPDLFARAALNLPSKLAVRSLGTGAGLTFEGLWENVTALATVAAARLRPGDRVAVRVGDPVVQLTTYLALCRTGAIVVPLSPAASERDAKLILEDCTPQLLVCSSELLSPALQEWFGEPQRLVVDAVDALGQHASKHFQDSAQDLPVLVPEQAAFIFYTGGSTGKPKGVVQSHTNYAANAENTIALFAPLGLSRNDRHLSVLPLHHGAGWGIAVALLQYGIAVDFMGDFDATAVLDELLRGHHTMVCLVPTMAQRLVALAASSDVPADALDHMRLVVCAGAILDLDLRSYLQKRFRNARVVTSLGQTEATGVTIGLTEPEDIVAHPEAIGRPVPGVGVAILDPDGNPVPPGDVGELCYRSEQVMLGYWQQPELTREILRGGWLHSGDLARRDPDGVIYLAGRQDDVIITGGLNVFPAEVEAALRDARGVADACVVGVPDREWGHRVHAVVVPDRAVLEPYDDATLVAHVRDQLRGSLSGHKLPKTWTLVDALPVTSVGKVDRARVRALAEHTASSQPTDETKATR